MLDMCVVRQGASVALVCHAGRGIAHSCSLQATEMTRRHSWMAVGPRTRCLSHHFWNTDEQRASSTYLRAPSRQRKA